VANAAILIDGKRPIGARVRRIAELKLLLVVDTNEVNGRVCVCVCVCAHPSLICFLPLGCAPTPSWLPG
jgi:hypothetical protein